MMRGSQRGGARRERRSYREVSLTSSGLVLRAHRPLGTLHALATGQSTERHGLGLPVVTHRRQGAVLAGLGHQGTKSVS